MRNKEEKEKEERVRKIEGAGKEGGSGEGK